MKKALYFGVLTILLLPLTSFAAFDTSLKYGATGSAVTELQEFLTDQKAYSGPISGNFYSLTLAGVKAFQTAQGISPVSGYWGPLTRAKASAMIDLSASDTDEQAETGTVSAPVATDNLTQLMAILRGLKQTPVDSNQSIQTPVIENPIVTIPVISDPLKFISGPVESSRVDNQPIFRQGTDDQVYCLNCIWVATSKLSKITLVIDGNSYTSNGYSKEHMFKEYSDSVVSAQSPNQTTDGILITELNLDKSISHVFSIPLMVAIDQDGNKIQGYAYNTDLTIPAR